MLPAEDVQTMMDRSDVWIFLQREIIVHIWGFFGVP
jgi:hypothetical protein